MELFEQIRREYVHGAGTIQGAPKKLRVHRRMVRQALGGAIPPEQEGGAVQAEGKRFDFFTFGKPKGFTPGWGQILW